MARALGTFSYRFSSEVKLHELLSGVLTESGYEFERERVLDPQNRADFFFPDTRIAIEVKVDGSVADALRQIDRYLHLDCVDAVLLASTQRWADTQLKERPAWQSKPFHMVRLRRQSL
jgi:hypothetical protein